MSDEPQYNDATPEDMEASAMIGDMMRAFMAAASIKSQRWMLEGRPEWGPSQWMIMLILHAAEHIRVDSGGAMPAVYADNMRLLADHAARGTELLKVTRTATHPGTGTVQ